MRHVVIIRVAIRHVIADLSRRATAGMHLHLLHVIAGLCHRATEHIKDHNAVIITDVRE